MEVAMPNNLTYSCINAKTESCQCIRHLSALNRGPDEIWPSWTRAGLPRREYRFRRDYRFQTKMRSTHVRHPWHSWMWVFFTGSFAAPPASW